MLTTEKVQNEDLVAIVEEARLHGTRIRPQIGGFPYLAEALRRAGIARLEFVVPSMTTVYVTERGAVLEQGEPLAPGATLVAGFDENALVAAVRADQEGRSTFPEFVAAAWRAGVMSWTVDLAARTCTYRSASGRDTYAESYPAVEIS